MRPFKKKADSEPPPGIPELKNYNDSDLDAHLYRKLTETTEAGGGRVGVYRKTEKSSKPTLIREMEPEDVLAVRNLGMALLDEFGYGCYPVRIYGSHGEIVAEYELHVGRAPQSDDEDNDTEGEDDAFTKLLEMAIESDRRRDRIIDSLIK